LALWSFPRNKSYCDGRLGKTRKSSQRIEAVIDEDVAVVAACVVAREKMLLG